MYWWTCPACQDRMAGSPDPRVVERDRNAHLLYNHRGDRIDARLLGLSYWPDGSQHVLSIGDE